jgi:NAD-dependent deacetylase
MSKHLEETARVEVANMSIQPLDISVYRNIVLLTGAGVSAASGIPTFRGANGLWNESEFLWAADGSNLPGSLPKVWEIFGGLRALSETVQPNAAHFAIADFQKRHAATKSITLITQNVDDLHQRAASPSVVELHGNVLRSRCSREGCDFEPVRDEEPHTGAIPSCPHCGASLRPDIVLFNEALPVWPSHQAKRALRDCDLFLAIGTSGVVAPASNFVRSAAYAGARTILVNLEPMQPRHPDFTEEILGAAEELLPVLLSL